MSTADIIEPYLEISDAAEKIGRNPRKIPIALLKARTGHEGRELPENPGKAIRAFCIECSGGSPAEARRCTAVRCPLWPFRMGVNPFHALARHGEDPA